jgi:hypothetical protein
MLKSSSLCLYSSNLKLLSQSQPNFAEMIFRWSPFKIVSVSAVLYPRWLPLLKIEISSNGQNCSILSQKVPKFELYKHNDEPLKSSSLCLYNSNLGTFWLKIEQFWPFEEISIFSNGSHHGYRRALTDIIPPQKALGQLQPNFCGMILGWPPSKIVSGDADFQPRWPKFA